MFEWDSYEEWEANDLEKRRARYNSLMSAKALDDKLFPSDQYIDLSSTYKILNKNKIN